MKYKVLKSLITPILGLSAIVPIAITSTSCGAKSSNKKVIPVESVKLDKNELELPIGDSEQLIATVYPTLATNKEVTWSSSDESIVSVNQGGFVTAMNAGTATITATSKDNPNIYATCTVTVKQDLIPVESIELDQRELELKVGEEAKLTATVLPENATNKNVSWESSDDSIVTVDQDGKVKVIDGGNGKEVVYITVIAEDSGQKERCRVNVIVPIDKIELESQCKVYVGVPYKLAFNIQPSNASYTDIVWEVEDPKVAAVTDMCIYAKKEGWTRIVVEVRDDKGQKIASAICEVTVE